MNGTPFVKRSELCDCMGSRSCDHRICCGRPIRPEKLVEHADRHARMEALRLQPVAAPASGGDGTVTMAVVETCGVCADVYRFSDVHTCEKLF